METIPHQFFEACGCTRSVIRELWINMYSLLFSLLFYGALAFRGISTATNPFNARWQLDTTREVGSSDTLLQLIGIDAMTRSIIRSLSVTERYEVTERTLRLVRDASVSQTDETFQLGVLEQVSDVILGRCEQLVTYQQGRIATRATRPDGAVYNSVRRIQPTRPSQFTNTMNFTTADGRHASCVRYYNRVQ